MNWLIWSVRYGRYQTEWAGALNFFISHDKNLNPRHGFTEHTNHKQESSPGSQTPTQLSWIVNKNGLLIQNRYRYTVYIVSLSHLNYMSRVVLWSRGRSFWLMPEPEKRGGYGSRTDLRYLIQCCGSASIIMRIRIRNTDLIFKEKISTKFRKII